MWSHRPSLGLYEGTPPRALRRSPALLLKTRAHSGVFQGPAEKQAGASSDLGEEERILGRRERGEGEEAERKGRPGFLLRETPVAENSKEI